MRLIFFRSYFIVYTQTHILWCIYIYSVVCIIYRRLYILWILQVTTNAFSRRVAVVFRRDKKCTYITRDVHRARWKRIGILYNTPSVVAVWQWFLFFIKNVTTCDGRVVFCEKLGINYIIYLWVQSYMMYIIIIFYYCILLLILLLYCYSIRGLKWFPVHKNNIIYRLDVFTAAWNTCPRSV